MTTSALTLRAEIATRSTTEQATILNILRKRRKAASGSLAMHAYDSVLKSVGIPIWELTEPQYDELLAGFVTNGKTK